MALSPQHRLNVLWHALKCLAGKAADREELPCGEHKLSVAISARVGRAAVDLGEIEGELVVAGDQLTSSTSSPNVAHVCAVILSKLPPQKALKLLDQLPRDFEAAGGELPHVDPVRIKQVQAMLSRLRSKVPGTRRGNVVFRSSQPVAS